MHGRFTGGGTMVIDGKSVTTIGVAYDDIQRPTGSFPYTESRLFNPETGEIGEIISWELPWR